MTGPTPTPRDREEAEQFVRDWLPDPTHLITARSAIALALAKAREEGRIEGVKHGMANTSELVGTAITRVRTDERAEIVAYLRAMVQYALSDGERVLYHGLAECIFQGAHHEPAPGKEGE